MDGDVPVYLHPDGVTYVALFADALGWRRWPAVEHGWALGRPCAPSVADECEELPPDLAGLALRLSGAPHDA